MNEVIRNIRDRRSIRSYRKEQITEDQLNIILNAGEYAASGMGQQATIMAAGEKARPDRPGITLNRTQKGPADRSFYQCAGHGTVLTGESPVTGIYRQV
jgi:hypothetical protein